MIDDVLVTRHYLLKTAADILDAVDEIDDELGIGKSAGIRETALITAGLSVPLIGYHLYKKMKNKQRLQEMNNGVQQFK